MTPEDLDEMITKFKNKTPAYYIVNGNNLGRLFAVKLRNQTKYIKANDNYCDFTPDMVTHLKFQANHGMITRAKTPESIVTILENVDPPDDHNFEEFDTFIHPNYHDNENPDSDDEQNGGKKSRKSKKSKKSRKSKRSRKSKKSKKSRKKH